VARKPDLTPEELRLKDLIRQAHEATQDLLEAIKAARALEPGLVSQFETIHEREIHILSNHLTDESNRLAATLNGDIKRAREMINNTIMSGQAVFDRHTSTVTITWGPGSFDASQPHPYPLTTPKETTQ
jgi:hypothetical protein